MNYPQQPQYPGYPQAPAQQYPPVQQPQFPQQAYPVQQQFPPQGYGAPVPVQPSQPLAQGTLDDYYNQPTTGSGPSISWKDKPIGTTYIGIVARDVTNGDVQQQINFQTKQPEFYRDGRPKFVLKVPLKQILTVVNGQPAPAQEFAENGGEGTYFIRGQARDELARAMAEAGATGAPKAGDVVQVSLVQRKPSGQGMNPANVVQIRYTPAAGGAGAASPAPAPVQQQAMPEVPQQSVQQYAPVQQQPQYAPPMAPGVPPVAQQQAAPQPPADLSPEQQALLARITGQGHPAA